MQDKCPPGEKKLFLVPSQPRSAPEGRQRADQLLGLIDSALLPLAFVFLGVVFLAGYLYMSGKSEAALNVVAFFLPPLCALMGAASAFYFRH